MARKEWSPPDAGRVKTMWGECVDDMLDVRRNLWLNTSYYHGDQWVGWNDADASVTLLEFANLDESKTRTTVNKFKPHIVALLSRLLRTPLDFECRPEGVDEGALRRARIERQVLQAKQHDDDWELTRRDNLQNTILGGVGAICVEPSWQMSTAPVVDQQTGETILLPEKPAVKLTALSAAEFGIEPGTRSARDARWWIRCTTLTPAQVMERFELDYEPEPDAEASATPMQNTLFANRNKGRMKNRSCLVYTYYERPCGDSPGCVVHVAGGKVVEQSPWPFSFTDRLNLRTFVQTPQSGTWKGDTICNDARQLQKNYNRAWTSVNSHIGKADNARMLIPLGSVLEGDDEMTGEAAEVVRYDASSGGEPHWMQAPNVPRWLREHILAIEAEMDDLFSRHAVSQGQAPGDRNSGLALSILAEKDETPLGLMAGDQQRGWQAIAEMVLETERFLLEQAQQQGADMEVRAVLPAQRRDETPTEVTYRVNDLSEHPVVHVPLDAVMPRSQAAVQDMMVRLAQQFPAMFEALGPSQMAAVLQVPDPYAFTYVADPQQALAQWENGRMANGADDSEVEIADWHDHDKHVTEHNRLRASASYRDADPQVREYIDMHIMAHTMIAQQQLLKQQQTDEMSALMGPQGQPPPDPSGALPAEQGPVPSGVPA